jgi:hypothetical protein
LSFSGQVKSQIIANLSASDCCTLAFLSACLHTAGSLSFNEEGMQFILTTESAEVFRWVNETLHRMYGAPKAESERRKKRVYKYTVGGETAKKILFDAGILTLDAEGCVAVNAGSDPYLIENDCCRDSYVKGAFCGCGYAYVPGENSRGNSWHVELVMRSGTLASELAELIAQYDVFPKVFERGESFVIYIKDGESVLNFFEAMGAPNAAEKLQRVMENREVSNILNRRNNCMIANMDKSFDASIRQIEAIGKLAESGELKKLSAKSRQTAELRLRYPSDSLEELAARAGISKSAMYHRLRKILEICDKST